MAKRTQATEPWERQPKESSQAFEAFCVYRDMGAERSIRAVGQKLGKSRAIIERWSSTWGWQERVRAWENFIVIEDAKRVRKEVRDRFARFGKGSDQLFLVGMEIIKKTNPQAATIQDALAALRVAITLADKHKGLMLPTETEETENNDLLGPLLAALLTEEDEDD